ncbi:hypothetical protein PROFUN_03665 [Planoprotostelium fungivorum]|uniref:Uncharacterized protein n=1 Tax=Planoprotostelium fungivorum TaxID=1890364 RepID=A0A2P6NSI1_9EUKA|nr:hypothetical protein PROFUN_03665 [Planoprotostelium fungivorum]
MKQNSTQRLSTPYIPRISVKDARKFVREQFGPVVLRLWGNERPDLFLEVNMVVCLYHDLKGHSWSRIEREIDLGFRLGHNSMNHNPDKMKIAAFFWAKLHVIVGDSKEPQF